MKRIVFLLVVSLFALPATNSFAKTKPTKAKPKAQRLVDKQLDRITAGSTDVNEASDASGGAIVGNSSTASIKKTGSVELDGGAQQDARALNLVNAAESGVANGVNVWDGRLDSQTAETELNVNQENLILQNQARSASVPEYVRPEANVDETFNSTRDTTNKGSVNTLIAILGQEIRAGKGFAAAGSIDLDIDGGSIEVTNDLTVSVSAEAGADIGFGLISGGVEITADATTSQTLTWILPDLSVSVEGVVCAVAMGSCDSEGTDSSTSSGTLSVRSPFALYGAQGEYIVVDDSELEVETDYSVLLSSNAQQNVRALNLVNAAGSVVANAVNVSRTPTVGPVLNLTQSNVIIQRR